MEQVNAVFFLTCCIFADGFEIPESWEYDRCSILDDNHYRCITVDNIDEICRIAQLTGLQFKDITSLKRIQNWRLYQRYQIQKRRVTELVDKYDYGAEVERQLFHATNDNSAKSIIKDGFNRDYAGNSHGKKDHKDKMHLIFLIIQDLMCIHLNPIFGNRH